MFWMPRVRHTKQAGPLCVMAGIAAAVAVLAGVLQGVGAYAAVRQRPPGRVTATARQSRLIIPPAAGLLTAADRSAQPPAAGSTSIGAVTGPVYPVYILGGLTNRCGKADTSGSLYHWNDTAQEYIRAYHAHGFNYHIVYAGELDTGGKIVIPACQAKSLLQWLNHTKSLYPNTKVLIGLSAFDQTATAITSSPAARINLSRLAGGLVSAEVLRQQVNPADTQLPPLAHRFDGLALDFERTPLNSGLLQLHHEVRAAVGSGLLATVTSTNGNYVWDSASLAALAGPVDIFMPLYYDSGFGSSVQYGAWVNTGLQTLSAAAGSQAATVPILAMAHGQYYSSYHNPAIETLAAGIAAIRESQKAGAVVAGAGVWGWDNDLLGGSTALQSDVAAWQAFAR